jgi:ribose transport system substrate-binding protein
MTDTRTDATPGAVTDAAFGEAPQPPAGERQQTTPSPLGEGVGGEGALSTAAQRAVAADTRPPVAVYTPPPGLDAALRALPLALPGARSPKRIGYLVNYSFHIWYQILIEVMTRRAAQYGASLVVRDAEESVDRQIDAAQTLMDDVDGLVITPAATDGPERILSFAAGRGIPVVVEANPLAGMQTMVAICDYDAGVGLGRWVGQHITSSAAGRPLRVLDVTLPTLRPCLLRSEGFVDGLRSVQPEAHFIARLNGEGNPIVARREAAQVLAAAREVDVIFAMDDETAHGAFRGYCDAGLDPARVALAGFGLSGDTEKDWLTSRGALKVSAAMFPEYVAVRCIDGLMRLAAGDAVPLRDVVPTMPMTPERLEQFYPRIDGIWTPDLRAVAALATGGGCTRQ